MCGRYAASRRPEDLVEEFELDRADAGREAAVITDEPVEPSWNVAPTDRVHVVVERRPRGASKTDAPRRSLRTARWGLVPSWAKDPSIGSRLINARAETVAEKPAFRRAFAARRALVPADGYYEWYASREPSVRRPRKQPFFLRPRDGGVLAMAGLYEIWRDPAADPDDPAAWLWTCTILTTTAEDPLGRIHDRMPMLVERDRYAQWLDPRVSEPDRLRSLLVPAAPGRLEAYPVSTEVNSVANNGVHLVEPLPIAEVPDDVAADVWPADRESPTLF